jgi:predicted nucleic acid-binding protein
MRTVLDASMAMAWQLRRTDKGEAALAQKALKAVESHGAAVPSLWYPEVANALLVAERSRVLTAQDSAIFLDDLRRLEITADTASLQAIQPSVLALGRAWGLTGYDAVYLELVMRTGGALATFDRKLADATRKAGGRVFGDRP